ncbi:MAG TPA: dockerin type I domain-containing protein, partial [Chitinophagaceae bacterium]|nr:dockerin type I domain-containing protein [Chitinophagaceae bacterium]
ASGMTFTGVNASMYAISGVTLPAVIPAGSSLNFTISFTPSEGGNLPTTLHILNDDCNEADYDIALVGKANPRLRVTAYLQGYYVLGMSQLAPVLSNQGVAGALPTDADDVTIELYKYDLPFTHTLHLSQTTRMNIDGQAMITLPYSELGSTFYLAIKHRNSIRTWASIPLTIVGFTQHKFTSDAADALGSNQVEVDPGVFAIYTGDINQDGYIDGFDFPLLDADITSGVSGVYAATDLNGDGFVDSFDFPIYDANSFAGISEVTP